MAKLTLIGLYNYMAECKDDLFYHLTLPEGIDKDTVIFSILQRGGEFEVLESNPFYIKESIRLWSKKWAWTFQKWADLINIKYDPLYNYDRTEEWTEKEISAASMDADVKNESKAETKGNTEGKVSAYDSESYASNNYGDDSSESSGSSSTESKSKNDAQVDRTHSARMFGNIGVMSSQQMFLQEAQDVAPFNIYAQIADVFLQEYVLPVY